MNIQQKCPICEGSGIVSGGFYLTAPDCIDVYSSTTETCRNCKGTGVVYVEQN